jgi:hypothetical protein
MIAPQFSQESEFSMIAPQQPEFSMVAPQFSQEPEFSMIAPQQPEFSMVAPQESEFGMIAPQFSQENNTNLSVSQAVFSTEGPYSSMEVLNSGSMSGSMEALNSSSEKSIFLSSQPSELSEETLSQFELAKQKLLNNI